MEIPLQIRLHHIPRSEALVACIRDNSEKLERFQSRITSCRVAVGESSRRHRRGRKFEVRVEVRAPRHEDVVSTLHRHEDVYAALSEAFDSARRQLEEAACRVRIDASPSEVA